MKNNIDINESRNHSEFNIQECSIYFHYFNQDIELENFPLDEKMAKFNFYRTGDSLYEVVHMLG